ncbi:hypothetical protein BST45_01360 [Mycobacterium shinjukuense]|uniref:DUF3375 family protein n=1 Tax=Mycobacterium shinjukuense TaxID=398694 RepID=UPI000A0EB7A4|nr:DUF3375 family protein [Mycobacterium shinjukuense]ORB72059.1 hypothetical protein BST45_01360 [Mycobacterium shinjukuense]
MAHATRADRFAAGRHPAWRLLRAENAPLIPSFLGRVFVDENVGDIAESQLVGQRDDELFALGERLGEASYPKSARACLDDWSAPGVGWLRKYYPPGSDEPRYDATPAVEKAVAWVRGLRERSFVGTESRLSTRSSSCCANWCSACRPIAVRGSMNSNAVDARSLRLPGVYSASCDRMVDARTAGPKPIRYVDAGVRGQCGHARAEAESCPGIARRRGGCGGDGVGEWPSGGTDRAC